VPRDAGARGAAPVVVACTQEKRLFAEVAAQTEGAVAPLRFVNIRETGGWGAEARSAGPKLAALLAMGLHVELVISDYGKRLLRDELGDEAAVEKLLPYLVTKYGDEVGAGRMTVLSNRDLGATIASGSHGCTGMVIVPCSMKTLAGVAHGLSRNLVERAADVMLKERRPLIIVPRETPMSLMQLKNMVLCAEAGAIMMPAMPAPGYVTELSSMEAVVWLSLFASVVARD